MYVLINFYLSVHRLKKKAAKQLWREDLEEISEKLEDTEEEEQQQPPSNGNFLNLKSQNLTSDCLLI